MQEKLNLKERFKLSRFITGEKNRLKSITLNHRRIFILPTMRGLGFVCLIILVLLIAFVYNNNLAYFLGFLLASVFFITILHSFKALSGLVIMPSHSPSVFAGEAVGYEITVENPNNIERFNLTATLAAETEFSLKPQEKKPIVLYSATQRRGWQSMGTVTLSTSYPLGLFRAWSPLKLQEKALVYPKPSTIEMPFPDNDAIQSQTLENQQSKKDNEDFYGIKEYQQGDSIRHIHWKAFAKGLGLFSKEYSSDKSAELWLNYEQTPGYDIEERLSQLTRWVIDAEKAGLKYGVSIASIKLPPNHGLNHYKNCLETLALF
ncbi:MAG: DUF58 domain-containing protein [Methylococcales bacterium]